MQSMTGYGKGVVTAGNLEITIEIKSVNNRYLDIMFRMPSMVSAFEPEFRKLIKKNVSRGKLNVFAEIKQTPGSDNSGTFNEDKLKFYYNNLIEIKKKLALPGQIEISHLLSFQDLFENDISHIDEAKFKKLLIKAIESALENFNAMRLKEGQHLINDMTSRLDKIDIITKQIKKKAPANVQMEFEKLKTRVNELLGNQQIDNDRLEQEIALISDKVDITEELTRMESHIGQFRQTLKRDKELGKKLTFILQEMHREANTMNSKTTDIDISHLIIQVKEEIEKIREQAQNIE